MPVTETEILTLPVPPEGMNARQYRELEQALKAWEKQVRDNAAAFPARGFELGQAQIQAFMQLLGRTGLTTLPPATTATLGSTKRQAIEWQQRYTLHELDGALDRYLDEIKSAAMYGLRGGANPTQIASWLFKATRDGTVNWRTVARTEMVRANAAGRYAAIRAMGITRVWFPRHTGACKQCRRLLEGQVFDIDEIENNTNYGRPVSEWVACCPLHPNCRHVPLPYLPDVFEEAQAEYAALEENGLDDKTLNEMFDSSGHLKPKYENDPRILTFFEQTGKTIDPLTFALATAVQKTARQEPPGLHHTSAQRNCGTCEFYDRPECSRYNWQVDRSEVCATWTPIDHALREVTKGFFDNGQAGLDPLLWTTEGRLRADVRDRVVRWWRRALGKDAPLWSRLFITGSAASRAWAGKTAGDVDVQVVVDFDALRRHHREYRDLPDDALHAALLTTIRASVADTEAANGLPLDAYLRPQHTLPAFHASVRGRGQGVWDIQGARWVVTPAEIPVAEDVEDGEILEGEGGDLALQHPDWLAHARQLRDGMQEALDTRHGMTDLRRAYDFVHDLRAREFSTGQGADGLGNFLWRYLMDYGPLAHVKRLLFPEGLEKTWPLFTWSSDTVAKAADYKAAPGQEHWITVHPHGEDADGIPVLIRENGDGSATVIGGAGGHLDFLRITHKGRIKDSAGNPKERPGVQQASSPEEAARREQQANEWRARKEQAHADWRDTQGRIEDLVRQVVDKHGVQLGEDTVNWDGLTATQRNELIKHALNDSLYQSTYGGATDRARAEAPSGPIVVQAPPRPEGEKPPREAGEDPADTADDSTDETAPTSKTRQRLRIPMPADIADQIQEESAAASVHRRRVMEANRQINQEGKPVDATSLQWEPVDKPAEAQRRAAMKAQQQINRELLGQVDKGRAEDNSLVSQALRHGAFDAFDAFTHQVLGGKTMLTTGATDLLGVNGTAQLVAHVLQDSAREGHLDLEKVKRTIDELTDERQARITDLDLNRAKLAAREVREMSEIYSAGMRGESTGLRTLTSAKSRMTRKSKEAATALGMAISGSEALHSLRALLHQPIGDITVHGFTTPAQIHERAAKARVQINDTDIVRNGPGDYTLRIKPDRVASLLDLKPDQHADLKDQLSKIRTGEDLDAAIEQARRPAGYARTLDPAQAKGSMFLRAAGSGVLGFAPGVGKTDTAIAAALEKMNAEPGHRVLIVGPPTALAGAWAKTIQKAAPGKSIQMIGRRGPEEGQEDDHDWGSAKKLSPAARAKQVQQGGADFNIIGFDTLKKNPELVKNLGHTIMVVDEMQYAKNADSQRLEGLEQAAQGVKHRWALTGTPLEKNMGEYHTMLNWARPGEYGSRRQFQDRFGNLNQYDHLTAEEKVQQFREATSTGAFFQSQDATHMPAFPELQREHVELADGHRDAIQGAVDEYNNDWQARHEARTRQKAGEDVKIPTLEPFGGRGSQLTALMKPAARGYQGPNTRVTRIADMISENPHVEFNGFKGHATHADGAHAGTYAPKSIIFGRETQPLQPIKDELERRGTHKVFYTDGSVGDNDQRLAEFLKHPGPAVLITSDTNKTARSLQFGDNGGSFQHGATQMIHADLPQNNADLQQRIARIWRRGAQAPCTQHVIYSGTPVEQQAFEQLDQELRTQQALGNPEDRVAGRETMRQKLARRGQRTLRRRNDG